MHRSTFKTMARTIATVMGLAISSAAMGVDNARPVRTAEASVHPWQDDAALRAVQFVGTKTGWAAGDRGTVWKSDDGGHNWNLLPTPTQASLRSLCFLTNQVGWIAGGATQPFTGIGSGTVLKTTDGGRTWEELGENLPVLHYVRFFGMEHGVIAGESTSQCPTGLLVTEDGGQTWQPLSGPASPGWLAADFRQLEHGVVVGDVGRASLVADLNLASPRNDQRSLRAIRAIDLVDGLNGWMVGDGGLVMRTSNGGVSWELPASPLPEELSTFADFHAIAARGSRVWLAGRPGGCIWMSSDGGAHWSPQPTGQPQPIYALSFQSEDTGWAVGAFGTILRTIDGGQSWQTVRGAARRAALLTVHARFEKLPFNTLAKYAADQGFRSVSLVLPRWGTAQEHDLSGPVERRAQDAALAAGAQAVTLGWRLPIALPELDRDQDRLIAEWQKRTEGRLIEIVMSNLVADVRQWRPTVVVIDQPTSKDAAGQLVYDAVQRAIRDAADPTRFIEHAELAGLPPWKVERVFVQIDPKDSGQISIEPYDLLPRLSATAESLGSGARSMLAPTVTHKPRHETFRALEDRVEDRFQLVSGREFWTGIALAPDSAARRPALPSDDRQFEQQRELAIQQRNFRGIVEQYLDQPQRAAQMIAELRNSVRGLPKSQAALQLMQLANDYRRRQQWDLAEATLIELVEGYDREAVAAEAMLWLLRFWSSEEVSYQRSRQVSLTARRESTDRTAVLNRVQKLADAAGQPTDDPLRIARETSFDPATDVTNLGNVPSQDAARWRAAAERAWQVQAVHMARLIRKRHPRLFESPLVQLPLSSALRRSDQFQTSDGLLRRLMQAQTTGPFQTVAAAELWVSQPVDELPAHLGSCSPVTMRPTLDGILGDECWRDARELRLASSAPRQDDFTESYPFALLCYDDQFLYVAANLPRVAGSPLDGPQYAGRTHDADLSGFDRITVRLDTNRDYVTSYEIHVDQRGHVSESCWEDPTWNPKLYVAVEGDDTHWRVELAIPVSELVSVPPRRSTIWAVSLERTIPFVGHMTWPPPSEESSSIPAALVQFR